MARRSTTLFEEVAEVTSKLPWWVGISCSLMSFFFLYWYAGQELPLGTGTEGLSRTIVPGSLRSLAFLGQFIVPAAFLLATLRAVLFNFKRKNLYDRTGHSVSRDCLDDMSWRDFEYLVAEYFRRRKFSVEKTKNGADRGVDLIANKEREKYFIQCRHGQAYKVGVDVVSELHDVMTGGGATGGIVVTSGQFTKDALVFARANNILALDGKELFNNLKSDVIADDPSDEKIARKPQKIKWALVSLLGVSICLSVWHFSEIGGSFFSVFSSQIKRFFPGVYQKLGAKEDQRSKPFTEAESKEFSFTDDQVNRAMEEELAKKIRQHSNIGTTNLEGENVNYLFEIELFTGGWIYTDNAEVTDENVTYKSANGVVVSLDRAEVKTMKRSKVDD